MTSNLCTGLFATEFWLNGEKVSNCSVFYLLFESAPSLEASYDDVECTWQIGMAGELPDFRKTESFSSNRSQFMYKHVEYARRDNLPIGTMCGHEVIKRNTLSVCFSSGLEVRLIYDHETESEHVEMSA